MLESEGLRWEKMDAKRLESKGSSIILLEAKLARVVADFGEIGVLDALRLRLELINSVPEGGLVLGEKPEIRGIVVEMTGKLLFGKPNVEVEESLIEILSFSVVVIGAGGSEGVLLDVGICVARPT